MSTTSAPSHLKADPFSLTLFPHTMELSQQMLTAQKVFTSCFLPLFLAALLLGFCSSVPTVTAAAPPAAEGVAALGWNLVRSAGHENVIVSPLSVWESLAMTHGGAAGQTAVEIAAVLGMPNDREAIATAAEFLRTTVTKAKGQKITLDIANRLWVQKGKQLEESFTSLLLQRFNAAAGAVDFLAAAESARTEINGWVSDHTAQKIQNVLPSGSITPQTRLVLTNAVFMKAPWADPFKKQRTQSEPFKLSADKKVDLPFMQRDGSLVAGKIGSGNNSATVCEIPYAGNLLSMIVIVPDAVDGVADVLAGLDAGWRAKWTDAALTADGRPVVRRRAVTLSLPKWTARKPLSLNAPLSTLGMKLAFTAGAADFSGIDGRKDLFVSAVVHEGYVEVTEEGTEAAAATAISIGVTSVPINPDEPLVVRADRPFLWTIVEPQSGVILCAGIVRDPRG